ncbi:MAG: hypothetical protein ACI9VR_002585 [Cognaticolwellia sp.]|jgi:hypothetical protein
MTMLTTLLFTLSCTPPVPESGPPTVTDSPVDSPTETGEVETGDTEDSGDTGEETPAFDTGDPATGQLLLNPSFEDGEADWSRYGDGSYATEAGAQDGAVALALGGSPYALLYQRVPAAPDQLYRAGAWARSESGRGNATLKLEFHDDSGNKLHSEDWALSAPKAWGSFDVAVRAPEGTTEVGLALVGSGEVVLWDGAWIHAEERAWLSFDVTQTQQSFGGLGTQVWGYGTDNDLLERALDETDIQMIRIAPESASDVQLQALHAITESRGIAWILHPWSAPNPMVSQGMLSQVSDFAKWTVDEVQRLVALGIQPAWIELMNEPDSQGQWSTGISPNNYALLSSEVRAGLDAVGLQAVGILGPGGSGLDYFHSNRDYLLTLEPTSLAGWSSHAWDDGSFCDSGAECLKRAYRDFEGAVQAVDPSALGPVIVSEYATKTVDFDGQIWPKPEDTVGLNATDAYGYGVRIVENTLSLLNGGAEVPVLWYLMDDVRVATKQWGLLAADGREKPGYSAIKGLDLPVGGQVLRPPLMEGLGLHAAGVHSEERTVLVFSNDNAEDQEAVVRLRGLQKPPELNVQRFESQSLGNVALGEPGVGVWVSVEPPSRYAQGVLELEISLPSQTLLRVELR